ncbi:MAG: polysaccharide biosynthesis protein [Leptolyngbyaceae cyanobacterium CSU_1_4]|nr:polysaccharide biosynthesis protein [Leptolyngbyaceae cyanobacterium CSU_1_4]
MTDLPFISPVNLADVEEGSPLSHPLPTIFSKSELSKSELIQRIQDLVPPGSPAPQNPQIIHVLKVLTQRLIAAYQADGSCCEDPFAEVWARSIHLYELEVRQHLVNQVVLVTGGEGCVGSRLIEKLKTLGVKRIISVDKARYTPGGAIASTLFTRESGVELRQYALDIRDQNAIDFVFATEKPNIVFHLAAQRLPWLAEIQIWETVTSNIFGTQNVIRACETHHVQRCIVSSTGKASRYLTGEVYAASKKMMEWQLAQAAQSGSVIYGMVRFTHMLDNSSFCQVYEDQIQQEKPINVHAPHRYIVGQNVTEATHLLLNALVFSEPKRLKFLLCRNLGWPVETLEVALYKILQSGQAHYIYFQGVTVGYEESFFRGQVDWQNPAEINTLINVIECQTKAIDPSGHMIMAEVPAFSKNLLNQHLNYLKELVDCPNLPESEIKQALAQAVYAVSGSVCAKAPTQILLKILRWGTEVNPLEADGTAAAAFQGILELLVTGLYKSLKHFDRPLTESQTLILRSVTQEVAQLQSCFKTLGWEQSETLTIAISALEALHPAPTVNPSFKPSKEPMFPSGSIGTYGLEIGLTA